MRPDQPIQHYQRHVITTLLNAPSCKKQVCSNSTSNNVLYCSDTLGKWSL